MSGITVEPMGDLWQASKVFYRFGERGVPDPPPGFRSWACGDTPREAVENLMIEIWKRTEGMGE